MKRLILATATALIAAGSYALAAAPAFGASTPNAPADTVARVTDALGSNTSTSVVDPKVTVHPRRALFDVHLSPGEVVYRTVTVTNNGDAPARLALTAVQTAWGGHPENPDHLRFSIARQADTACTDASHPAAPWMPLGEVKALDRGQLEPQESAVTAQQSRFPQTPVFPEMHAVTSISSSTPSSRHPPVAETTANLRLRERNSRACSWSHSAWCRRG